MVLEDIGISVTPEAQETSFIAIERGILIQSDQMVSK